MKKAKFSIAHEDEEMLELVKNTDHKILAIWAIDCTNRVIPYFEEKYPNDHRPQQALKTLQTWIDTGVFKMAVIRRASLDSHGAAREVGEDNPARSAARAAGQAVATAHAPRHAYGSAIYAQQAIFRANDLIDANAAAIKERDWQYQRLVMLKIGKPNKYTVYIIRTDKNTLYTGQTVDLEKRLEKHKKGKGAKYLRAFSNFDLVYTEQFETLTKALKREWEIKQMTKENKEKLIKMIL